MVRIQQKRDNDHGWKYKQNLPEKWSRKGQNPVDSYPVCCRIFLTGVEKWKEERKFTEQWTITRNKLTKAYNGNGKLAQK